MFRGFSSLLGLFFLTAGAVAVVSLTKTPAVKPASLPRNPDSARAVRGRYLALESPSFHARFSVN